MESISTHLPGILLSYGAFLIAIASPGPNVLAVIGTSMSVNRSSGIALALGVATGTLTWRPTRPRLSPSRFWGASICYGWPPKRFGLPHLPTISRRRRLRVVGGPHGGTPGADTSFK
jgi:hypothetical protein